MLFIFLLVLLLFTSNDCKDDYCAFIIKMIKNIVILLSISLQLCFTRILLRFTFTISSLSPLFFIILIDWPISQMYRWYIICNFYHVLFIYLQFFSLYIYFISIYINTYFPMCVLNLCYTFRSWLDLLRLRQNVSCQRLV